MAANPRIVVEYVAETAQLKQGFSDASKASSGFSSRLKGIAKGGALAAGAAGIGGLVATLKVGIGEWQESTKVAAQTQAVLKSTGHAANVTSKHVDELATSLMKKSGVDDEAIASGENLLLTFTKIRNEAGKGNDIFDQATATMLDMSVALKQDASKSAIQLGKALNDPIKGITALRKVGVSFTEGQTEQIKKLVESGKAMEAQKIILAELNKEFGGSAAAVGKTLPGQLAILRESFNNFAGELVGKMIPVLQQTIAWLRDHWPEITAAFNSFWASVAPILTNLGLLIRQIADAVIAAWPTIEPIAQSLGKQIQDMAIIIAAAIKLITDLLRGDWAAAWEDAKRIVTAAVDLIKERITSALNAAVIVINAAWSAIRSATSSTWNAVVDKISDAAASARNALTSLKDWIAGVFLGAVRSAVNAVGNAFDTIADGARDAYASVQRNLNGLVNFIEGLVGKVRGAANAVANAIRAPINAVIGAWNGLAFPRVQISIPSVTIAGKKIGGGDFGFGPFPFPDIPRLAAGGIVTSPTLAMVGEAGPEAVVPLGGHGAPVEVRVFIGDTELRGLVRSEIVDTNTGIARTLLAGGVA